VDPKIMGVGPVVAIRKLLAEVNMSVEDIDLFELNEAYASQSLACINVLGLPMERTNVNGRAIALGHPLGMSGARLLGAILYELRRRNQRYGVVSLCIGGGNIQGLPILLVIKKLLTHYKTYNKITLYKRNIYKWLYK
jgi:acetyl-CoA C-acetyltransferase